VALQLTRNVAFPCQRALSVALDRVWPSKQLIVQTTLIDEVKSLARVSGTVALRSTKNLRNIVRETFSVSKSRAEMKAGRWRELGSNFVGILYIGPVRQRPIDPQGDEAFGRVQVTARHFWRERAFDCSYAGRFYAKD
jgi:hypothetical protein